MIAHLDTAELSALLKDFHLLTGIKIVIFDADYNELIAFPPSHCPFCRKMQTTPRCRRKCTESNLQSFRHCQKTGRMIIYHCHAGLIEAAAPLMDNGILLGYIMFGQITDTRDDEQLKLLIEAAFERFHLPPEPDLQACLRITRKSTEIGRASCRERV